jgi:hypothetical protein
MGGASLRTTRRPSADEVVGVGAESAALGQLVVALSAEHLTGRFAPHDPRDEQRVRGLLVELGVGVA